MATYHLDPIVRIEGHLAAEVESTASYAGTGTAGPVTDAKIKGEMFRGFENILQGRHPGDALEITQRICGVCPVPHGLTSTHAVEDAITSTPTGGEPNTVARLVRNLVLGSEYLMSHITHFYHLAALSYVQGPGIAPWTPYYDNGYYQPVLTKPYAGNEAFQGAARDVPDAARVAALGGVNSTQLQSIWDNVIIDYVEALKQRRKALEAGAIFAGRMPLTRTFVVGGVTCRPTSADVTNFKNIIGTMSGGSFTSGVGKFIQNNYIPLTQIVSYLYGPYGGSVTTNRGYDNNGTVKSGIGAGNSNYLAYGIFNLDNTGGADPNRLLKRGYVTYSGLATSGSVTPDMIAEYIANSRYTLASGGTEPIAPSGGYTDPNSANGYSWLKSPRLNIGGTQTPCQVGPLSRMVVHGQRTNGTATADEILMGITDEEAGYMLGDTKTRNMLPADPGGGHTTLGPLLAARADQVQGYFGTLPATFVCGCSVMDRHRARAYEALKIAKALVYWANELNTAIAGSYTSYTNWTMPTGTVYGVGMEEAPRGALGHWVKVKDGVIDNYQCVVPTTWNASPCHSTTTRTAATRGPIEECCVGSGVTAVTLSGAKSGGVVVPVEVLRVVQSFDPCIACAVHVIEPEGKDLEGRCLE